MAPRLSYVLLADAWPTIRDVVARLAADARAGEVELVVVTPADAREALPEEELAAFAGVRVVPRPLLPMGLARAAGIEAATADVVVLGETHAFPEPGYVDAVLAAYRDAVVSVTPRVVNGNAADGALGWTGWTMDYGRWAGDRAGKVGVAPSYNASFRRSALLELGDDLPALLAAGPALSHRLRARGGRLVAAPAASVRHLNVDLPLHWAVERFLGGRLTGAGRAATWPPARRVAYVCAAPLIALLLASRALRDGLRSGEPRPPGGAPALVAGAALWAAGEAAGYATGPGNAERLMLRYELHKARYVRTGAPAPAAAGG